ncbi:PP2C family protein-serine/threonine phosphatase [Planctomicrobium sp. SH661]|uniref:PP2C family protein-serine/threonine phosphatase n=1 Tax=Planctomicrobium sp. SH661 TaxID=3448124 RepID=UPI003F5B3BE4
MYWEQSVQCEAATDIGLRRQNNEDAHCIHICRDEAEWRRCGHLLLVADGMGGHAVGELASRIASETVPHTFLKSTLNDPRKLLQEAILAANQAIHERGTQNVDFLHMGTTCTVLALTAQGAVVGHVGDSRLYRVRRDRVDQLTFDHSLEWELERQHGSLEGIYDAHQHKNVITRSLGPEKTIDVDIEGPFPIFPEDTFLLCSDGVSNQISDPEIGAILRELPPSQAAKLLINLANIRGGPDNSTVVVARVGELPANVIPSSPEIVIDDPAGIGWSWLVGFWAVAITFVSGLAMQWTGDDHEFQGIMLVIVSMIAAAAMLIALLRHRRTLKEEIPSDDSHTHHSRPHRTAVGLSSRTLLELLIKIDAEVQRSAREDGWSVDWTEHSRACTAAQAAAREKRYSKGIRDAARAIGIVMEQLPRSGAKVR